MNFARPKIYKIRIKTAFLKDPETIDNKMPFLGKINQHFLSFLEMKQKTGYRNRVLPNGVTITAITVMKVVR